MTTATDGPRNGTEGRVMVAPRSSRSQHRTRRGLGSGPVVPRHRDMRPSRRRPVRTTLVLDSPRRRTPAMPTHHEHSPGLGDTALEQAATVALRAPSIFNTQPWRWRLDDGVAELRADRERQLHTVDPQGRLLTLSCGVALHHLRAALAASGTQVEVARLPEPGDPDLLARVRVTGKEPVTAAAMRHYESLLI